MRSASRFRRNEAPPKANQTQTDRVRKLKKEICRRDFPLCRAKKIFALSALLKPNRRQGLAALAEDACSFPCKLQRRCASRRQTTCAKFCAGLPPNQATTASRCA